MTNLRCRVSRVCGLVVIGLGCLGLVGWLSGRLALAGLRADLIPMAPNTAVLFILLGAGLAACACAPENRIARGGAVAGGLVSILLAGLTLFHDSTGLGPDIHCRLFRTTATFGMAPSGHMSPVTAGCFALAGLSLLCWVRRVAGLSSYLGTAVALVGTVVGMGYLYGAPFLYGSGAVPVALPTGLALMALGSGLAALSGAWVWPFTLLRGPSTRARLLRTFLPVTLGLMIVSDCIQARLQGPHSAGGVLVSALDSLVGVAVAYLVVHWVSRGLGEALDRATEEIRRAEETTAKALEETRNILESIPDGFFALDEETRVTYFNRASEELLSRRREDVLSRRLFDAFPEARGSIFEENYTRALRTRQPLSFEAYFDVAPYENWYEVRVYPRPEGISVYFLVVTERKQAEEERRRLEAQIQHGQKLESLGILAGGIAHDFNNLLMGVLGNTSYALSQLPPEAPARPCLEQVEQAALRAADLANQMLAYSGKGRFVVERLDLAKLVEEMSHLLESSISKKALLQRRLEPGQAIVEGDAAQLQQIIMNLIINASDALGDDSGVITVSASVVEVDREYLSNTYIDDELPEGPYVVFEVSDTGCGMDEETRLRMFDPFFTTKRTGRGLGMAAVLGIVRGHGGAIKVYSEPGRGTAIKVFLPRALLSAGQAGPQVSDSQASSPAPLSLSPGFTVLVADDEPVIRELLGVALEAAGFRVLMAADGEEAVAVFGEHASDIDVVVLDMSMPKMGGEEAFLAIQRLRDDVPVILSSGFNEQDSTTRLVGRRLAGFIQKPYRPSELVARLKGMMNAE